MATYQPFAGYLTAYQTAVQNVQKTIWDPQIIPLALRAGDVTRFFSPVHVAFPKGKALRVRVQTVMSQTSRYFGTPFYESGNLGRTLPNPAQSPEWAYWEVAQTDIMGVSAGLRYAFPTELTWDAADVSNLAEFLSRQGAEDLAESVERGLITRQTGDIAKVVAITNSTAAYAAGSVNWTTGNTTARLWLNQSALLFHQGARVDLVHKNQAYASSLRTLTVQGAGAESPTSGIYGYIDVDASTGTTGSSFTALAELITAATPAAFVYMSGEYAGSIAPEGAPAATTGRKHIYSLVDWFKSLNGAGGRAAGVVYNVTRTTLGYQWALPVVVDKYSGGDTAIALSHFDSLAIQMYHKRLDQVKLTNYVALAGPFMVEKMTKLTDSVNRRVDGATAAQQSIATNYGFDGVMMHHPAFGRPIAIQPVRGLPENMIFLVQPSVCELLNLGPPAPFPWSSDGVEWHNEQYTSGSQGGLSRTLVQRSDRLYFCNTLIRAPLWNGALLGVKPE